MGNSASRTIALQALLRLEQPLSTATDALRQFPWDSDDFIVLLTRHHVDAVFRRYIDGKVTAAEIEAWANALEGREDIGFDEEIEGELRDVVHELANPFLTGPLTLERATAWIKKLR